MAPGRRTLPARPFVMNLDRRITLGLIGGGVAAALLLASLSHDPPASADDSRPPTRVEVGSSPGSGSLDRSSREPVRGRDSTRYVSAGDGVWVSVVARHVDGL